MNRNTILTWVGAAVIGAMVFGGLASAAPKSRKVPALVEAQRFELKDADGRVLATLHGTGGGPQFSLFNRQGNIALVLSVLDDGTAAAVVGDIKGKTKVNLMVLADGSVLIGLEGDGKAELNLPAGKTPNMGIWDRDGKITFQAVR